MSKALKHHNAPSTHRAHKRDSIPLSAWAKRRSPNGLEEDAMILTEPPAFVHVYKLGLQGILEKLSAWIHLFIV